MPPPITTGAAAGSIFANDGSMTFSVTACRGDGVGGCGGADLGGADLGGAAGAPGW